MSKQPNKYYIDKISDSVSNLLLKFKNISNYINSNNDIDKHVINIFIRDLDGNEIRNGKKDLKNPSLIIKRSDKLK